MNLLTVLITFIFFPLIFCLHLLLCKKFTTEPKIIRSMLFYLYIATLSLGYCPFYQNLPKYILVVFAWTIILIDFEHHRIPNFITGYLSILFTLIAFARANFLDSVIGGAEFLTFFGILALLSKGSLGLGDVKLAGVIGLVVGSVSVMEIIKFSIFASIFGLVSICTSRAGISRKARIPFAAPMISACLWIWPMLHMKG